MLTSDLNEAIARLDYKALGRAAWRAEVRRLEGEWAATLATLYLDGWPSAVIALVYERAWEDGHANGYAEVEGRYQDLAELIEAVVGQVQP